MTPNTVETLMVKLTEAEARAERNEALWRLAEERNNLSRRESAALHRQIGDMQRRIDRQTSEIGALKAAALYRDMERL